MSIEISQRGQAKHVLVPYSGKFLPGKIHQSQHHIILRKLLARFNFARRAHSKTLACCTYLSQHAEAATD